MTQNNLDTLIPAWVGGQLRPLAKLDVHRRGLLHKAVSVFVFSGEELLIQKRAAGKYHTPLLWANTCCTHPGMDEAPSDCAVRRLREELGIVGLSPEHCGQVEYRADVGGGLIEHELVDVYRAEAPRDLAIAPNHDEVESARWIRLDDLVADVAHRPEIYTPWLRIYLAEHGERIFPGLPGTVA